MSLVTTASNESKFSFKPLPQLTFLPRPILLRVLKTAYTVRTRADTIQDADQLFELSSMMRNADINTDDNAVGDGPTHLTAITVEQANLLSGPNFGCNNPKTNYHNLSCGHAILTSTDWPSADCPKSACASNCERKSSATLPATDIASAVSAAEGAHSRPTPTVVPFICPVCIERSVRRNYIKIWHEYRGANYVPAGPPDVNVKTWTYCAVRALEQVGMRVAQGTTGVYLFGSEHECNHINFVPSVVEVSRGPWSFEGRNTKRARRRSRSPDRFGDEGRDLSPVRYIQLGADRDQSKGSQTRYRDHSVAREGENFVMNELAGRLEDAKVGLVEDKDVDGLLVGIGAIST